MSNKYICIIYVFHSSHSATRMSHDREKEYECVILWNIDTMSYNDLVICKQGQQ